MSTHEESAIKTFTAGRCTVFDISGAPDLEAALGEALGRARTLDDNIIVVAEERRTEAAYHLSASGRDRGTGHVILARACDVPLGTPVYVSGGRHAGKRASMAGRSDSDRDRFWVIIPGHGPGLVLEGDFQTLAEGGADARA